MNEREYHVMAELEADHWWYRGLRDLISRTLVANGFTERSGLRVLDAGCGTGANLKLLGTLLGTSYLGGFDVSPLAVEYARGKVPEADIYPGDVCNPPLHSDAYDLILSCDVLCIVGLDAAADGMRRLTECLAPGGLLILNLPAFSWLFSAHDLAVGTRQRMTAKQVRGFLHDLGLDVTLSTYRLFALFPAVVLARLPSMLCRPREASSQRSDVRRSHPLVNRCLTRILRYENAGIMRGLSWPWGSSVFAVGRRR
jgi:SAM-dependent methyltransferase